MYALGRITQKHPDYNGPTIGPKMANKNERNFSDEQIRQGRDAHIGLQVQLEKNNIFFCESNMQEKLFLQAGQNKGATQAGHGGMGNTRHM